MSSREINWAYITGFFDGEGSIYLPKFSSQPVRMEFSQLTKNDWVLHEISAVFDRHEISWKLYVHTHTDGREQSTLKVFRYESVEKCLKFMLPLLIVKRERAVQALEILEARKQKRGTETHCRHGHKWAENAVFTKYGVRQCRACKAGVARRSRARRGGG